MKKALSRLVAGLMAGVLCISLCPSPAKAASSVSVKTKYLYSGAAHAKYTNLAYYAEPVVADINKDGRDEVVSVSFAITVTDAQSGKTLWQVDSGKDRSTPYNSEPSAHYSGAWCSPVVKDIDGDGYVEIISTHKNLISVLDHNGYFKKGWPKYLEVDSFIRSLAVDDFDGDGKKEIIFGSWTDSITNPNHDTTSENTGVNGSLYILDSDLKLISRTQLPAEYPGYLGAYQTNGVKAAPAVKDVDGDGEYEVILNTSYRSVCAYDLVGSTIYDTPFTDMRWHWAKDYVNTCVKRGYFNGTGNNTFTPSGTMTRGMLATVLYRMAGSPQVTIDNPFTDVPAGQWYTNGAIWCYEKRILANMDSTTMDPNALVTRQELAYMLYQYSGAPKEPSSALTDFSDSASVSDWAQDAMEYCVGLGVLQGSEGKLNPQNSVTRAEAATMLVRFADAQ